MFSVIENALIKNKCQIFTPKNLVNMMLDLALYKTNLYGKKFLENSCGNGEILIQAVIRYIEDCLKSGYSRKEIKLGLERDFVAYEIDDKWIDECKSRLDEVASTYNIFGVCWNIICVDYLMSNNVFKFDYIVGNPPYIAYPDLPQNIQKYVKDNFKSCKKGKFDYSYAFIEKSYSELNNNGMFVYIIPNNIFKNVFGKKIREIIKEDLYSIDDFPNRKIFGNVLVSPAIICVKKNSSVSKLIYRVAEHEKKIDKIRLGDKWFFDDIKFNGKKRIGDHFKVSSSVATLLNEVFVLKSGTIKNGYYEFEKNKIEVSLIRKAASPKNKKYKKNMEYIIFPYYYDADGKLNHYSEKQMYENFPFAMKYLATYKERLQNRTIDKGACWYEYGRSQAIQNINQNKILLSSVISDCTEPYLLDINEVPYSGLYIVPLDSSTLSLESLLPILKSSSFKEYIKSTGICVSGTSKRISPKDIENFCY